METAVESVAPDTKRSVAGGALRASLGRTPLWLLTAVGTLLLSLLLTLPWHAWFSATLGHGYEPGSQLVSLDQNFRTDHGAELGELNRATGQLAALLVLFALLMEVFFAGGWLQVFLERTEGHSVRRFFFGGARYFGRFLRVLFLTLVGLALLAWLGFGEGTWDRYVLEGYFGVEDGDLENLRSEMDAVQLGWLQAAVHFVLFALVLTWADYTRTRLAMHETRSAFVAGANTFFVLLRHPIKTLRPMLLLVGAEQLVLAAAGLLVIWIQGGMTAESGPLRVVLIGLLGILAVVWGKIVRGARYAAAVRVSRDVVSPPSGPNPWSHTVGGPGGPQYPIDDHDEYGVSL